VHGRALDATQGVLLLAVRNDAVEGRLQLANEHVVGHVDRPYGEDGELGEAVEVRGEPRMEGICRVRL